MAKKKLDLQLGDPDSTNNMTEKFNIIQQNLVKITKSIEELSNGKS